MFVAMYALSCASSNSLVLTSHTSEPPGGSANTADADGLSVAFVTTFACSPSTLVCTSTSALLAHATPPAVVVVCCEPDTPTYVRGAGRSTRPRPGKRSTE